MKIVSRIACIASAIVIFVAVNGFKKTPQQNHDLLGAWQLKGGDNDEVLLLMDGYFSRTTYSKANKKFIRTRGGSFEIKNNQAVVLMEFDTQEKENIGESAEIPLTVNNNELVIVINGKKETWSRVDNGKDNLAGTWKISARMQDGQLVPIHQTGARKTVKILTATRFQWAAINPETKEFSGTGGGTYTFKDGKYTENIEFFSRDSSRVGASLSFEGKLENGEWHHSGLSSRGDKIYEVWKRLKQ